MTKENLSAFLCVKTTSVVDAMQKIDKNVHGIVFVTDDEGHLVGSLTDGDIRRWLIKTGDLDVQVERIMNPNPRYIFQGDIVRVFECIEQQKVTALPILDASKRVVDIIFKSDRIYGSKKNSGEELENVPVVIMAGGKGTRLYPYTKILPKPLIPIGDIPIVERIMERFCAYGASKYFMTVNYKKNMIKSYFADNISNYVIEYVDEDVPLGTAGSLTLINEDFDKPIFITNCDILVNADYTDIYKYHKESGNVMTIVSALKKITVPYGVLHSSTNGVVTGMEEKPQLAYFVNTGVYVINPEAIKMIPKDTFYHMTHLSDALISEGYRVGMYPVSEEAFLDMGEFEEMRRMEQKLNIKTEQE